MSKIEAHIRPNGHEGYIVEVSAPHLGPARAPIKTFRPKVDGESSHRVSMAHARDQAQAFRDGFNECVEFAADALRSFSPHRRADGTRTS